MIISIIYLWVLTKPVVAGCTIGGVPFVGTNVVCDSFGACQNQKITGCEKVTCSGENACAHSEIDANTITCSGYSSCWDTHVNGGMVTCSAKETCWGSSFGGTVDVECVESSSCLYFEFQGKTIRCKSGACYQVTQAVETCMICETNDACFGFDVGIPAGQYGSCGTAPPTTVPPTTAAPTSPPCFSGETDVVVPGGKVAMKDIKIGDSVLTKSGAYQPIFAWAHMDPGPPTTFLQIHVKSGRSPIEVTEDHNIYVEGKAGPLRAGLIKPGDILVGNGSHNQCEVVKVSHVNRQGVYAPLTRDGSLVVGDGVLASCYISVVGNTSEYLEVAGFTLPVTQDMVDHTFASPLRVLCLGVSPKICDWHNKQGEHYWFAFLEEMARLVDDYSLMHMLQLVVYLPIVIFAVPFMAIELAFGPVHGPFLVLIGIGVVVANPWIVRKPSLWFGAGVDKKNKSISGA